MIQALITKLAALFLVMVGGYIVMRLGKTPHDAPETLTKVTLFLIMPCAIINSFRNVSTDGVAAQLLFSFGTAVFLNGFLLTLSAVLTRVFKLSAVEHVSIAYPNSFNLIVPIVTALYPDMLIFVSPFMVIQTFLMWSHGRSVMCGDKGFDLKKMFCNVQMFAICVGLILLITRLRLPAVLDEAMTSLGGMIGTVSVLITGLMIGRLDLLTMLKDRRLYPVSLLRLVVLPLILMLIMKFSGVSKFVENGDTLLLISMLATMAPSASAVQQLAMLYGTDPDRAGAINVVTMLLCIITMPLLVWLWQIL